MSSPRADAPRRRWWHSRRVWVFASLFAILLVVSSFANPLYRDWQIERELAAVVAETDRLDPGWRYEAMLAKREAVPDAENAYHVFANLAKMFPMGKYEPAFADLPLPEGIEKGTEDHRRLLWDIQSSFDYLPEATQLNKQQMDGLESEWKQHQQAFEGARRLREFQKCRFPSGTLDVHGKNQQAARAVEGLLRLDFLRSIQLEQLDDGLNSVEALLAVIRFEREELDDSMQFIRAMTLESVCRGLNRILAHGEPNSARLIRIQAMIDNEEFAAAFLHHARLRRVETSNFCVELMKFPRDEQLELMKIFRNTKTPIDDEESLVTKWYANWFLKNTDADPRQLVLAQKRFANRLVEVASLPEEKQHENMGEFLKSQEGNAITFQATIKMHLRISMSARTTRTAIALERYRQAKGAWPKSLEQLVPDFLNQVPKDLYTGKPLQYRLIDRGAIVYSVGEDKIDNEGKLRPEPNTPGPNGLDIGVRLWDPEHRRQLPLPPVVPRPKQDGL